MKAGIAGQIRGPFEANQNIIPNKLEPGLMQLGVSIDTKDLMPFGDTKGGKDGYFSFTINGQTIRMGRSGMYETGNPTNIVSFQFDDDAPASVKINYLTYES